MTGTLDDSPLLGGTAQQRIDAFGQLAIADRYLVVFDGGDHMIFSGGAAAFAALRLPGMAGDRANDAAVPGEDQIAVIGLPRCLRTRRRQGSSWLKDRHRCQGRSRGLGSWKHVEGR